MRRTVCEIFLAGWRSSQIISRTQNCLHTPTFLRIQLQNILRKWSQKSRKRSIYTHFPKDRNCEVCFRTKITRAPVQMTHWRRRTSRRKVWWFDNGRSQSPQWGMWFKGQSPVRYAVIFQDLATQWIFNLIRAKQNLHMTRTKSLLKFLEPSQAPNVVYTDNSMEFGRACEDLSCNHRTATPHQSETNCIAERAVRRIKEGTSAVLMQSGLGCHLRNVQDFLAEGTTSKDDSENHSTGQ